MFSDFYYILRAKPLVKAKGKGIPLKPLRQTKLTIASPAVAPAPQPSAMPVISPDAAEDPAPSTGLANLGSQTDVTTGASDLDKGKPSLGNDPSAETFAENLMSNPGLAKFGLSQKSAEEIQRLARQCLEKRNLSAEEEAQEAEDIKFSDLLAQVQEGQRN